MRRHRGFGAYKLSKEVSIRCTECNKSTPENYTFKGRCGDCRAKEYGVMPHQAMEYEFKNGLRREQSSPESEKTETTSQIEEIAVEAPNQEEVTQMTTTTTTTQLTEIAAERQELESDRAAYCTYNKSDLKDVCQARGLSDQGPKQFLLSRILNRVDADLAVLDAREAALKQEDAARQEAQTRANKDRAKTTKTTTKTAVTFEIIFVRKDGYGDEKAGQSFLKTFKTITDFYNYSEFSVPELSPKSPVLEMQYRTPDAQHWGYKNYRYLY